MGVNEVAAYMIGTSPSQNEIKQLLIQISTRLFYYQKDTHPLSAFSTI